MSEKDKKYAVNREINFPLKKKVKFIIIITLLYIILKVRYFSIFKTLNWIKINKALLKHTSMQKK